MRVLLLLGIVGAAIYAILLPHEAASAKPTIIWNAAANSNAPLNRFFTIAVSRVPLACAKLKSGACYA